jgi:hypothetical protein
MNYTHAYEYTKNFLSEFSYKAEAVYEILGNLKIIFENEEARKTLERAKGIMCREGSAEPKEYLDLLDPLEKILGISKYGIYLVLYILATEDLREKYKAISLPYTVEYDTLLDLRNKCYECHMLTSTYGLYSAPWMLGYYRLERFAFGGLQFNLSEYGSNETVIDGREVKLGDKAIAIHIPRSDRPFDRESRLDSYKRAYRFFKDSFTEERIPFICSSWLLYPFNREVLCEGSNILSFMDEFKITKVTDESHWLWRIFGVFYEGDVEAMPEDTRLKRAYKERLRQGKTSGSGYGVFLFDGEKIINN